MLKTIIPKEVYVDGGCGPYSNGEGWGSVVSNEKEDLLTPNMFDDMKVETVLLPTGNRNIIKAKFDDVDSQQNNGAELLAMIAGLRICIKNGYKILKTDSDLIFKWWSIGHVNAKTAQKMDKRKLNFIYTCKNLREKFEESGGKIIKIRGSDNYADLGYHK